MSSHTTVIYFVDNKTKHFCSINPDEISEVKYTNMVHSYKLSVQKQRQLVKFKFSMEKNY